MQPKGSCSIRCCLMANDCMQAKIRRKDAAYLCTYPLLEYGIS